MGHIEPCRPQLATLSSVDNTYSARFEGVSKLSWLEPCFAIWVIGMLGSVELVGTVCAGDGAGCDEWSWRHAMNYANDTEKRGIPRRKYTNVPWTPTGGRKAARRPAFATTALMSAKERSHDK